jgi:RND family efflux transporter MFP subunit
MTFPWRTVTVAMTATLGAYSAAKHGYPAISQLVSAKLVSRASEAAAASLPRQVALVTPPPPPVVSAPPDEEAWTGVLLAQAVDLTARIDTRVKGFSFRVGDHVRAGDTICELDTTAQQHDLAAAEAALRASQAEAWNASVSVSQARDRESRRAKMFQMGASEIALVSKEELLDSKFASLSASSRASAASASADERRARLAYLHQIVKEATLRAPFDGVIATRYVEPGAHVRQGVSVVRVVGRGALRIRFAVPETEAAAVKLGARVAIEWDDRTLHGTVDRVAPEVESASSSIVMEAFVESGLAEGHERSALAGRVVGVRLAHSRPRG